MEAAGPLVTISAAYGAGGGFVGPQVAKRLSVRFVDRAITASVAAELGELPDAVEAVEGDLESGLGHWLSYFAAAGGGIWGGFTPPEAGRYLDDATYKSHVAAVLRREADHGAVILGRGAQVVLSDDPRALHVRLDGPVKRRIAQAIDLGGLDERAARRAQHQTDAGRHYYFHRLYHGDVADPRYYHLLIDATAVPLATCVAIIVAAVRGREELRRLGEAAGTFDF